MKNPSRSEIPIDESEVGKARTKRVAAFEVVDGAQPQATASSAGAGKAGGAQPLPRAFELRGDLRDFGLGDVIQLLHYSHKTGMLTVRLEKGESLLYFKEGQLVHAESPELEGEEVLFDLFQQAGGQFHFLVHAKAPRTTITKSATFLLMEAARQSDEANVPADPDKIPSTVAEAIGDFLAPEPQYEPSEVDAFSEQLEDNLQVAGYAVYMGRKLIRGKHPDPEAQSPMVAPDGGDPSHTSTPTLMMTSADALGALMGQGQMVCLVLSHDEGEKTMVVKKGEMDVIVALEGDVKPLELAQQITGRGDEVSII